MCASSDISIVIFFIIQTYKQSIVKNNFNKQFVVNNYIYTFVVINYKHKQTTIDMNSIKQHEQLEVLKKFEFSETVVLAGNVRMLDVIALKPIVLNLGLSWSGAYEKLKRDPKYSQLFVMAKQVADDGKTYDMVCMSPVNFQDWLWSLSITPKMNTDLWELYKKGLVVHLLLMLKISLDEIQRLKTVEYRYYRLKGEFFEYVKETEEGKELNKQAKNKWKSSNERKSRIMELLNENSDQLLLVM